MTGHPAFGATVRPIPAERPIDLLEVAGDDGILFQRDGEGFAGVGRAIEVGREAIGAALAAIAVNRRSGDGAGTGELGDLGAGIGPVAFGALPFLPEAAATLIVPDLLVAVRAGNAWATAVHPVDSPVDPLAALDALLDGRSHPAPSEGPSSFTVTSTRPPQDWEDAVASATARLRAGEAEKVVLAREVTVEADRPLSVATILRRLASAYPGCFLYSVEGFCGASPELLVGRVDDVVRAQPMAGTSPRRGDPDADRQAAEALLASATYRHEHQVTIEEVRDTLLAFASYVDYQPEPSVVPLANVMHLASHVEGRLSHPPASVLELVAALHPTPAVCGRPRAAALRLIAELEELDRGRYAGTVGWVDRHGNGEWAVSIRGAEIAGNRARIIAGNGMVGASDPPTELLETRAKLQAMLAAIVRP